MKKEHMSFFDKDASSVIHSMRCVTIFVCAFSSDDCPAARSQQAFWIFNGGQAQIKSIWNLSFFWHQSLAIKTLSESCVFHALCGSPETLLFYTQHEKKLSGCGFRPENDQELRSISDGLWKIWPCHPVVGFCVFIAFCGSPETLYFTQHGKLYAREWGFQQAPG